ncbi:60S acidic ribosomal protein P1 [Mycena galericulata]|nr:60S acidic ribosomal protein P1 [Mycena galericulata]
MSDSSSSTDLAATYAALILADAESEITAAKILALTTAAGVDMEPIWATLLAKALEGKNVNELLCTVGASPSPSSSSAASASASSRPATNAPVDPAQDAPDADAADADDDDDSDGMFDGGLFD